MDVLKYSPAVILATISLVASVPGYSVVSEWTGSDGNWSDPENWSTDPVIPDNDWETYDVVFDGHSDFGISNVVLDRDIEIQKLSLYETEITGNGTRLTVVEQATFHGPDRLFSGDVAVEALGDLDWNGGTFSALGGLYVQGKLDIRGWPFLNDASLVTHGETIQGALDVSEWTTIRNMPTGVWTTTGSISSYVLDEPVFYNEGAFIKEGTLEGSIEMVFHNTGSVEVSSGRLLLDRGGTSTGGLWSVAKGSSLSLTGGHFGVYDLDSTSRIEGSGNVALKRAIIRGEYLIDGNTTVGFGGDVVFETGSSVRLNDLRHVGGSLIANSPVELHGSTTFNSGTWGGSSTFTNHGSVTMNAVNGTTSLTNARIRNLGSWQILEAGSFTFDEATFENGQGATFTVGERSVNGNGRFTNYGKILRESSAPVGSGIGMPVVNYGQVDILIGSFRFGPGNEHHGATLNIGEWGRLALSGPYTVAADTVFTGAGTLELGGGVFSGDIQSSGGFWVSAGTNVFHSFPSNGQDQFSIGGGTAQFETGESQELRDLLWNGGIAGSDPVHLVGDSLWRGGEIGEGARVANHGALSLVPNSNQSYRIYGSLINEGLMVIEQGGSSLGPNLVGSAQAEIVNQPDGMIEVRTSAGFNAGVRQPPVSKLTNHGSFLKTMESPDTRIGMAFENHGLVEVEAGELHFQGGYLQKAGELRLAGGDIGWSGRVGTTGELVIEDGILSGSGLIESSVTFVSGGLAIAVGDDPSSHESFDIRGGVTFSELTNITVADTPSTTAGTYLVLSATEGISGPLPSLDLPSGWSASLVQNGTSLHLAIDSIGGTMQESWRLQFFGYSEDSGDAANSADPDGDSVSNILEYALGGNPVESDRLIVPKPGSMVIDGRKYLTLTFTQISDPRLRYEVWATSDFSDWGTSPVWSNRGDSNTDATVVVTDTVPIEEVAKRVMRLKVTER